MVYDLVIIGAGPGLSVEFIQRAMLKTVILEKESFMVDKFTLMS